MGQVDDRRRRRREVAGNPKIPRYAEEEGVLGFVAFGRRFMSVVSDVV